MARPNSNDYLRPSVVKKPDNSSQNLSDAHRLANSIANAERHQADKYTSVRSQDSAFAFE